MVCSGTLQEPNRLSDGDPYAELDRQLDYLACTLDNTTDSKSWTHGGEGPGYKEAVDAHQA